MRLRCAALKCETPLYKVKHLRSVPKLIDGLASYAKMTSFESEFGTEASTNSLRCCAACYVLLHRLSSSQSKGTLEVNSTENVVGRPPVAYKTTLKRTQRRIRKNVQKSVWPKMAALKVEVQNMGVSYEEIC